MTLCWKENAQARPTFSDIVTCLSSYLQSHVGYLAINNKTTKDTDSKEAQ